MTPEDLRGAFPVLKTKAYLNTGTYGPLPGAAMNAMSRAAGEDLAEGRCRIGGHQAVHALRDEIRATLAGMIGAQPGDISLARATTEGTNILVNALPLGPDDEIITSDEEHHAFVTSLVSSGAQVKKLALAGQPAEAVVAAIKAAISGKTRLIALSHVIWTTGQVLPAAEICRLGPPVLLDAAQSVGAIPVDVKALDCAAMVFPGQKWLLGPDATGGLYLREDWQQSLRIPLPSSFGHIVPAEGDDIPREGARRFDPGPVPRPNLEAWQAALEVIEAAGPDRYRRAAALADSLRQDLRARGQLIDHPDGATLVSFDPQGDPDALNQRMEEAGVVIRTLPTRGWLRASVGWWNNREDLERLLAVLDGGA